MLQPAGPRVLIKPDPVETEVRGIIVSLGSRLEKAAQQTGTIVAIGSTAWTYPGGSDPAWAHVGDRVVYSKFGGRTIVDPLNPNEDYIVLNDEDVLALVLKDEE